MAGIPPSGGYDAPDLLYDAAVFDASLDADAQKVVSTPAAGVEADLDRRHVLKGLNIGASLSSVADATAPPQAAAILVEPTTLTVIALYQAGSQGAVGLVYRKSTDLGVTWDAEVQVSSRQDVHPAAVLNPATGDVHVAYALRGSASLSATWSVWGRVLAWTGTTWSVGAEFTVEAGSATRGLSNVTLDKDGNGFLVAAYSSRQSADCRLRTAVANGAWDLSLNTVADELTVASATELKVAMVVRFSTLGWWGFVTETGGTFRILHATDVLSASQHALTVVQDTTYFEESSAELDAAWNPLPTGQANGQLVIAQKDGDAVLYRTWTPATSTLSGTVTLAGDATFPARYPAVARNGGGWIVGWLQLVDTNKRALRMVRSEDTATVIHLDTDPGADGWGWLQLVGDVQAAGVVLLAWCDTLDPGTNQFNVHLAMTATDIFKQVTDAGLRAETLVQGPVISTSAAGVEVAVIAGEAIGPALDTGTGVESVTPLRQVNETGTIVETLPLGLAYPTPIAASGIENVIVAPILDLQAAAGAETLLAEDLKAAAEVASAAEALQLLLAAAETGRVLETLVVLVPVGETGTGVDLAARLIPVSDTGTVNDTTFGNDLSLTELGQVLEVVSGGFGGSTRLRHTVRGVVGSSVVRHDGGASGAGWTQLALAVNELYTRLFAFEDIDEAYTGIMFRTRPTGSTTWARMERSQDGGATWTPVGPAMAACVAHAADGTLYLTGNDGTVPGTLPNPPYDNPTGVFGYAVTMRQVWKSTDKGQSWSRVFDDTTFGTYGRYPTYVNIAADPASAGRVAAVGVRRGSVQGSEVQFAVSATAGASWATIIDPGFKANNVTNHYHSGVVLAFLGSGRLLFGGNDGGLVPVADRLWVSDDLAASWSLVFSHDPTGSVAYDWTGLVYRNGRAYASRSDTPNEDPTTQILTSADNGATWQAVTPPVLPSSPGRFSALAWDHRLNVLYVGTLSTLAPVWRMDDPPGGTWVNLTENIVAVTGDADPNASRFGLAIVNEIAFALLVGASDAGRGTETLVVVVPVAEAGAANDGTVIRSFKITDAAHAAELVSFLRVNALAVRLFMHRGRLPLRVEGTTVPIVPGNPDLGQDHP